jgi:hypothetical protein
MAAVTPVPFALALLVGMALFVALTYYLVQDARRPVDWSAIDARAASHAAAQDGPRVSHTRVAAVCVVFTLWSLWATARPVSGWR